MLSLLKATLRIKLSPENKIVLLTAGKNHILTHTHGM